MATLGDLVVNLTANTNPLTKNLNVGRTEVRSFAGDTSSMLATFGKFAGMAGIGFSVAQGISMITENTTAALRATRKLEAVLEATGHVAGVSATHINELAEELSGLTSFEDDAIVGGAAVLATFDKIRGTTFDRAIKAAMDLSEVFGQDLETAITQVGKALQSPADGLTTLRRIGVTFTAEQKQQIKALQESGNLMEAQAVILGVLENKFGGAAEKLASPWQQLKNEVGNVAETVGIGLKPAFDDFFRFAANAAKDLRGDLDMMIRGPMAQIRDKIEEEKRRMLPIGGPVTQPAAEEFARIQAGPKNLLNQKVGRADDLIDKHMGAMFDAQREALDALELAMEGLLPENVALKAWEDAEQMMKTAKPPKVPTPRQEEPSDDQRWDAALKALDPNKAEANKHDLDVQKKQEGHLSQIKQDIGRLVENTAKQTVVESFR